MYWLFLFLSIFQFSLIGQELPLLYNKNYQPPHSPDEQALVDHVKLSLQNAFRLTSKLNGTSFSTDRELNIWHSDTPSDHLLNNLCNLPGASHLHVGLLKGGSFVAALYGNQDILNGKIGVDWFLEYPRFLFEANCTPYLDKQNYEIIDGNCFDIDKSLITSPIDIYFYDADHSLTGHALAFTYYNDVFSNIFVAVVDDWVCPWVRRPTFKAFEMLNYCILYEAAIPANELYGHGQYVAVIKKPSSTFLK